MKLDWKGEKKERTCLTASDTVEISIVLCVRFAFKTNHDGFVNDWNINFEGF